VQWLDQQLAIVNGRSARSGAAGVFDGQLLKEVQAFQAAAGLVPDGVVGAYTLIQLNSRTSQAQPTLTDRPKD
jgi:murein L,D-transpeptidase YcbB/YkuD